MYGIIRTGCSGNTIYILKRTPFPLLPFFHAANGGIWVDHGCCTGVEGLFACGEGAGGIHGADRLGGMASGSCLVFGTLAARSACSHAGKNHFSPVPVDDIRGQLYASYQCCPPYIKQPLSDTGRIPDSPQEICRRVKELMWRYGGIIRTEKGLVTALETMDAMGLVLDQNMGLDDCEDAPQLKAFLIPKSPPVSGSGPCPAGIHAGPEGKQRKPLQGGSSSDRSAGRRMAYRGQPDGREICCLPNTCPGLYGTFLLFLIHLLLIGGILIHTF